LDGSKSFRRGRRKVVQYVWTYLAGGGPSPGRSSPDRSSRGRSSEASMAKFVAGQPVVTAVPSVVVDAGLPVGQHRFRLEVLTDTGQRSPPDEAVVQVQALTVGKCAAVAQPFRPRRRQRCRVRSYRLWKRQAPCRRCPKRCCHPQNRAYRPWQRQALCRSRRLKRCRRPQRRAQQFHAVRARKRRPRPRHRVKQLQAVRARKRYRQSATRRTTTRRRTRKKKE